MLTPIEKRTFTLVYSILCKFPTIPFAKDDSEMILKLNTGVKFWNYFTWILIPFDRKDGEMILKQNNSVKFWNYFTWILVLVTLGFQLVHFPIMIQEKNMNMLVLHGSSFVGHLVLVISKLNLWIYKLETVYLINQMFYMNATWGMTPF